MAAPKYVKRDATSGRLSEVAASETGPSGEVVIATNAAGYIDPSFLQDSGVLTAVAGENLTAGQLIYIKASDSKAYKATWSSSGNPAIGFVLASYTTGQTATYYLEGLVNNALSGLTVGSKYYGDSSSAGAVTATVPSGAGVLHQPVGVAISATALAVAFDDVVVLAA